MPKIAYIEKRFSKSSLYLIKKANEIIEKYTEKGLSLTLRQLYYQFVSRNLLANKDKEYIRLGNVISNARLAGLIDWNAIEDRTRNLKSNYHNTDPGQAVQDTLKYFMLDKWENQPYRVQVWIEKEALIGVIERICRQLDVPYFACKGYTSQSELWSSAMRSEFYNDRGQIPVIIHLGDHDPSGVDMTRDIIDRHKLFMGGIEVERIALNYDQIEKYNPPPNPAKMKDRRANSYVRKYGYSSWELDALDPEVIRDLIEKTVFQYIDLDRWNETAEKEKEYITILTDMVENWNKK